MSANRRTRVVTASLSKGKRREIVIEFNFLSSRAIREFPGSESHLSGAIRQDFLRNLVANVSGFEKPDCMIRYLFLTTLLCLTGPLGAKAISADDQAAR